MEYRVVGRIIAFCLSIILLSSSFFLISAESEKADVDSETNNINISNNENNSYYSYKESVANYGYSDEVINQNIKQNVLDSQSISFLINVSKNGLYCINTRYKCIDYGTVSMQVAFTIDGKSPFSESEEIDLPRMWKDEEKNRIDGIGNQIPNKVIPYNNIVNYVLSDTTDTGEDFVFALTKGKHILSISSISGEFYLDSIILKAPDQVDAYHEPRDKNKFYNGNSIIIEGESAVLKNSYSLSGKSDNTTAVISPNNTSLQCINYIGGSNWNSPGDTIIWETPNLKAGYYKLGFSFRQSSVLNGSTYRKLTIDGKVPFYEASEIPFEYNYSWQQKYFQNLNGKPYYIYLSEGSHKIGLSVVSGKIGEVRHLLTQAISELGSLYFDINRITGETIDTNRDYELFSYITNMESRLKKSKDLLNKADSLLYEATGHKSGSNSSIIKGMNRIIDLMLKNQFFAHRYVKDFYTNYCSLAASLQDINSMPLDLDKLVLTSSNCKYPFDKVSVLKRISFSVKKFFISFIQDYNNISGEKKDGKQITVWVNWGRDQAQMINSLVSSSFTEKTGIDVNIKIVNATMVQAVLSGKGPDCTLQHPRSEPVNLAMRGVLYDLTQFDDLNDVLQRFQKGAERPYYYKGGLYALPDTESFPVLYYRKDIFSDYGLSVPKTWNDFKEVCIELSRNNLTAWIPIGTSVDVGLVFPSMLLQNGINLYTDDGKSTQLSSPDLGSIFTEWTDYYTKLKLPYNLNFYNRFRTGTCPIGIDNYTMYQTLKATAPEIDNLWSIALIPGTLQNDGTVLHTSNGSGTGCAILKQSKHYKEAWEFLKWWTESDIQLSYTNELESVLGPTGRVAVSNIKALPQLSWDPKMEKTIISAWNNVKEIPEYPGSYYVSRSIYQSFWNVANKKLNATDVLTKYSKEADDEMQRKWEQYNSNS